MCKRTLPRGGMAEPPKFPPMSNFQEQLIDFSKVSSAFTASLVIKYTQVYTIQ